MDDLTLFRARQVVTLDPARPRTDAVLVASGRIVATGTTDELARWGEATVDDTFADTVLCPGFVEAHSHIFEGGMWAFEYVGWFDRLGPDGAVRRGCRTLEDVIERLRALDAGTDDPDATLIVWGFDPIYFGAERLGARHLDVVSATRPIFVFHASGHLATVNTALMETEGFADGIDMEGVPAGPDGRPTGELQEPAAMSLARSAIGTLFAAFGTVEAIQRLGMLANRTGTTTLTDLGTTNLSDDAALDRLRSVTAEPAFPARLHVFHNPGFGGPSDPDDTARFVRDLAATSTDRLRFGHVKLILDGSIQGFTARLGWPGYLDDRPNGLWLMEPERFDGLVRAMHGAGITVHTHCNGDEATEVFIETVERAVADRAWLDHRHTVQHCQLTTPAQYRRLARLGCNANIFANHVFYWGDQHRDTTVGPDRAPRMDACATAHREGVRFSVHSDASITPLGQLHTMWCAVNRLTASGEVLGAHERIGAELAWRATTVDAAHQLRMDHEIGTIEAGKAADLVALDAAPTDVEPGAIRDIGVAGTVLGGRPHPVETSTH